MSRTDVDRTINGEATGSKKFWNPSGVLVSDVEWSGLAFSLREIRQGTVTPNYNRLRSGGLPVNPFYYYKRVRDTPTGYREWEVPGVGREVQTGLIDLLSDFGFSGVIPPGIDDAAAYSILQKLKDRDVDLSVAFGERRQTASMFADVFNRTHNSWRAARRGDFSAAFKTLASYTPSKGKSWNPPAVARSSASNWLQWQYGVRPLLLDVHGSAVAIAKAMSDTPPKARCSASKTHSYSLISDMSANWGIPTPVREWGSYTCKYVLYFSQEGGLPALSSLGLTNPISTAWELTTLSFVFDWFYDVGSYLDALDSHIGLSFESGSKTTFLRRTRLYRGAGRMPREYLFGQPLGFTSGSVSARDFVVECRREALSTWPSVPLPRITVGLGNDRATSLASLVVQRLRKK